MSFENVLEDISNNLLIEIDSELFDEIDIVLDKVRVEHLGEALKDNQSVTKLKLINYSELGDSILTNITPAFLQETSSVVHAILHGNGVTSQGLKEFGPALAVNSTLAILDLSYNDIGDNGCIDLALGLQSNHSLTVLGLINNNIGCGGVTVLAKALEVNNKVNILYLTNNHISSVGCEHIGKMLSVNKSLHTLCLENNQIDAAGARALFSGLQSRNAFLEDLNLNRNVMGDKGARYVAECLKFNTSLVKLKIKENGLYTEGFKLLADGLEHNFSLLEISFWNLGGADLLVYQRIDRYLKRNYAEKEKEFLYTLNSDMKTPWNRSRLMFVGQGRAGKSATIKSLLGRNYVPNLVSTIGATITECETMPNDNFWTADDEDPEEVTARFAARIMLRAKMTNEKINNAEDKRRNTVPKPADDKRKRRDHTSTGSREMVALIDNDSSEKTINAYSNSVQQEQRIIQGFYTDLLVETRREEDTISFSIWDFGGQTVFYAMHHIFMTKSGVYALTFDVRELLNPETRQKAKRYLLFWLKSIKLHAPFAPVVTIGTNVDAISSRQDLITIDRLLKELCKGVPLNFHHEGDFLMFPIDNKSFSGITKLKSNIEAAVRKDKFAKEEVKMRWIVFLDRIISRSKGESLLSLSAIRDLAESIGIKDQQEQEACLRLFHERGYLVHLTSTMILKENIIIRPQWLMDVFGKVIREHGNLHQFDSDEMQKVGLAEDAKMINEQGLTSRDFLEYVWKGEDVDFLIDLMKRTMLMSKWNYTTNSKEIQYLIPSILSKHPPDGEHLQHAEHLHFVFDFSSSFLPYGVFQRLICLCVASVVNKRASIGNPDSTVGAKLYRHYGVVEFDVDLTLYLLEDLDSQRIMVYIDNAAHARRMYMIINSMLEKLNYDVMNSGLVYESLFLEPTSGNLLRLAEARDSHMYPWFHESEMEKESTQNFRNIVIERFLDQL